LRRRLNGTKVLSRHDGQRREEEKKGGKEEVIIVSIRKRVGRREFI
jgi:hypothetical protein